MTDLQEGSPAIPRIFKVATNVFIAMFQATEIIKGWIENKTLWIKKRKILKKIQMELFRHWSLDIDIGD